MMTRKALSSAASAMAGAVAILFAVVVHAADDPSSEEKRAEEQFFKLHMHSFDGTLTSDNGLLNWLTSAGTMALRDRVQLLPPVPDRHALLWNKKAVKTNDFEIQFTFAAMGAPKTDGVFAMWISPDNFTTTYDEKAIVTKSKNWAEGLESIGHSLLSNSPKFKGIGIFFLSPDAHGKNRIATVINSGESEENLDKIRSLQGDDSKTFDWLNHEMIVTIRVKKDTVTGTIAKQADPKNPTEFLRKSFSCPQETYFGFSGYSGTKLAVQLDVNRISARNFDKTKSGEDLGEVLAARAEQWQKTLAEEKRYIDQVSQMEAVKRLTLLLGEHMQRYVSGGMEIKATIAKLETRLDALGADFSKLVAETDAFDFKTNTFDVEALRGHVKGISSIFDKDKVHTQKLSDTHSAAKSLKDHGTASIEAGMQKVKHAKEQAAILESHASQGSSETSVLLMIFVAAVAFLGCLFLKRMRYYEKKHYI
eukprot:TRINITY_DN4281_c0_g2_i1.p1 TRINITY_DN4281_c0_g2~~TRINITY_DN4281_c0_g2_i1.p1  ORF type:complete len:478 (+),score=91.80 TRINITY_DN4281_c0_g2_i1:42-1475(+)